MRRTGGLLAALPMIAAAITIGVILGAAYVIAKTPGDTLGRSIVPAARDVNVDDAPSVDYTLATGRSAQQVADDLHGLGVISSPRQFDVLVRLMGQQEHLSAGDHTLTRGMSALAAIDAVTVKKDVPVLRVTFPEGIRIEEMAERAERAGFGTKADFLTAVANAKPPATIAGWLPAGATLQGYLFPDTYILPKGATAVQLVDRMLQTFEKKFTPDLVASAAAEGLSPHQALTLASIVEREAVIPEERPRIAGVFLNRLAAGDLLGADPTVQFAVALNPQNVERFGYWKRELTLDDLKINSPYNTRLVGGLPPGPITNPGLDAIKAAANAEKTNFYYFVADAKKADGSHVFAVTQAEHDANIARVGSP